MGRSRTAFAGRKELRKGRCLGLKNLERYKKGKEKSRQKGGFGESH